MHEINPADISGEFYDYTRTMEPETPYNYDYSKTLTMKLALAIPDRKGGSKVFCNFEEALEIIRSLTEPEWKVLYSFCGESCQEEHRLSDNAERCRKYRVRKKLRERFEKGELDE